MDKTRNRTEKAQSLVELAVSLTFLLLLVAGVVDLGRAFFTYIALRDAAQEGAVYAAIAREDQADPFLCDISDSPTQSIEARIKGTSNTQIVDLTQTLVDISFLTYDGNGNVISKVPCDSATTTNTNACALRGVQVYVTYQDFPLAVPFLGTILGRQTIRIQASIIGTVLTPPCN